ncbi:hypothetical protein BJ508DRAFT_13279 [Ascobolus immersus RN42]|uniref:Uncharacterized protein n=1 Tax=Ascobolus immersus RN42 TaxID=1160509 RepID=A0A3N4IG32_ASCIM|nr:hypothetical protein BJ508DRAFT_13279 [Ascobolus immersus RN42]
MRAILPPPLHTLLLNLQLPSKPKQHILTPSSHAYYIALLLKHLPSFPSASELTRLSHAIETTLTITRNTIHAITIEPLTNPNAPHSTPQFIDAINASTNNGTWVPIIDIPSFHKSISIEEHIHMVALQYLLPNQAFDNEDGGLGLAEYDYLTYYASHNPPSHNPERYWLGRYGCLLEMLLFDRLLDLKKFGNASREYEREQGRVVRDGWRDGVQTSMKTLVGLVEKWGWEKGWNGEGYGRIWVERECEDYRGGCSSLGEDNHREGCGRDMDMRRVEMYVPWYERGC